MSDRYEAVPSLASGCDPTTLTLSPAEGFLLSRIDGQTSWRLLREIGGLPPDSVDACLDRWLADGLLVFGGMPEDQAAPTRPASGPEQSEAGRVAKSARRGSPGAGPPTPLAGVPETFDRDIDESLLDSSLGLDVEVQRRILIFEANLGRPPHELLDVEPSADPRQLKKAYFKLSKDFHPDRFFRRDIGSYGERLHRVFKRILEAHEALAAGAGQAGEGGERGASGPVDDRMARLRQRMPFERISEDARAENRRRADELWKAAVTSRKRGQLAEAENSAKVGLSFHPRHEGLRTLMRELQLELLERQLSQARADGEAHAAFAAARGLLELEPDDPHRRLAAAELALDCDQPELARRLAEEAGRELGDTAAIYRILALAHLARGEPGHALRQAQRAIELDPKDAQARSLIASLKKQRLRRGRSGGAG